MTRLRMALAFLAGTVLAIAAAVDAAAQPYPARPITIVLPFAPGGGGDLLSRIVGAKLEQRLGKPVIIDGRPGGGGGIAANIVAKSPPDGYTLFAGTSSPLAINVTLFRSLPYDAANDFLPVAYMARSPWVLVVNPKLPVNSVKELIAYARANPGKLSFGSSGVGGPGHLYMEVFKSIAGLDMIHVPYKGVVPAINDAVAGHIQVMFCDVGPCSGQLAAKTLRPLGIALMNRFPTVPDIPTIHEAGVPNFDYSAWQMLFVPAKTPPEIVDRLHTELKAILDQPETKRQIIQAGFLPAENPSVDELHAFVKRDIVRWGEIVTKLGLAHSQ